MYLLADLPFPVQSLGGVFDPSLGMITMLGVLAVVVLLLFSAFFASAEIAIFSLGDHRIESLIEKGSTGAKTLSALKRNPRRLLVTILVGNNIANIGMSAITTGLLGLYLNPGESVLIATFGVTSIVLLFGETAPKSYGVEHSESWALRTSRPLRTVQVILYPLVELFDFLTSIVNRLMGSQGNFEAAYLTRSEIQSLIRAGQRAGVFTAEEHQMLQRLLRFRNRIVKETMRARRDIVAVEAHADLETAIDACLDSGFTQIPIYEGVLDNVVGIVHIVDLVEAQSAGEEPSLRSIAREPYVVPETKEVDDLLTELRAERQRMAIVVDEFGTTAGIVTIEDIVEEIIGEVLGETEAAPIRWLEDGSALVRGELNIHDANEALRIDIPESGEFETVAGFIMDQTGRFVAEGERVEYGEVGLIVETVDNNRILELRVELPEGANHAGSGEASNEVGESE